MPDFKHPDTIAGIDKKQLARDPRTTFQQLYEEIIRWDAGLVTLSVLSLAPYVYDPLAAVAAFPFGYFLYRKIITNKGNLTLPVKLPVDFQGETDYHDPKPGGKKFNKANGTIPFANLRKGAQEVWFAGKDMLTHLMVIGTTGAGKTETLVSLAASSAFATGSGLVYVDAKAAPKLIAQFFTLARIFGREDDMRIINYMTGNKKVSAQSWERLSNTTNPFALGSADSSVQMLTSLLPSGGGDNQVFLDRAISMVKGVMPALVELRDRGIMNITAEKIQQFIQLEVFINLAQDKLYLDRDGNPVSLSTATSTKNGTDGKPVEVANPGYEHIVLSPDSVKSVRSYLQSTPGYSAGAGQKQPEEVAKQFGFGQMYFTRALSNLATTYGHIYQHELSEVDFADVILNGRVLIVLVPAMEQSGEERKALGKVILSSIRNAMALGLGNKAEGFREDVLESLPIDLKTPSMIIVDEYAEVATEGFAVTATQGRGLGMSVVFAGQDLAGFVRASKEEADMIFSNTRIKCLMALEDPELTWSRFNALAGEMSVVSSGGWDRTEGGIDDWMPSKSANVNKVGRLNLNDLKAQTEGQAHVFERSNIHKVQMFHHGIDDKDLVTNWRLNRMIKVRYPPPSKVAALRKNLELADLFMTGALPIVNAGDEAMSIISSIKKASASGDKYWPLALFKQLGAGDNLDSSAQISVSGGVSIGGPAVSSDIAAMVDSAGSDEFDSDSVFDNYDALKITQAAAPEVAADAAAPSMDDLMKMAGIGEQDDERGMADRVLNDMLAPVNQGNTATGFFVGETAPAPSIESVVGAILDSPDTRWIFSTIQAYSPEEAMEFTGAVAEMGEAISGSHEAGIEAAIEFTTMASDISPAIASIPGAMGDEERIRQSINSCSKRQPAKIITGRNKDRQ